MLELNNIGFTTNDGKSILNDVNLKIEDKFVAITGPNGSGKSTLAKLIAGIYIPTEGKIIYNGTDITNMSISERAKLGISFAFQQPVRFKGLKVKDILNIASGGEKTITECCNFLSEVGLCARDYIDRDLDDSLSGGEMKRIEIATLLARNTELNIFDEPEAGIDLWSFRNLIRVFEKMTFYIALNIPEDFPFETKCRNEIDKIFWLEVDKIPQNEKFKIVNSTLNGLKDIINLFQETNFKFQNLNIIFDEKTTKSPNGFNQQDSHNRNTKLYRKISNYISNVDPDKIRIVEELKHL